jgi:GTPase SAR1 family protein
MTKNYYVGMSDKYKPNYRNPGYGKMHHISIPFRCLIIGGSGSGKTNTFLDLLHHMPGTFDYLLICCRSKDEPLYRMLADKLGDQIGFVEVDDRNPIPPLSELSKCIDKQDQILVVFDDLINDKKSQKEISEYFTRARKAGGGISVVYITQSYFAVPKMIRLQATYLIIKKLNSINDLRMIVRDFTLNPREVMLMYDAIANSMDPVDKFILVDLVKGEQRIRF